MTESYMKNLMQEDKMSKILSPIEIIYLFWLLMTAMFNFKVFMVSVTIGFAIIAVYAIIDALSIPFRRAAK